MKAKKGVSLVVLVVTVIVLSILVTITVAGTADSISKSKLNMFETELSELEELCVASKEIGVLEEYITGAEVTYTDVKSKVDAKGQTDFLEDITLNKDTTTSKFYQINVDKIGANNVSRGKGAEGVGDYFYVSTSTLKVYYPRGLKVKKKYYFSLNSRLSSLKKNENIVDENKQLNTTFKNPNSFFIEEVNEGKTSIILRTPLSNKDTLKIVVTDKSGTVSTADVTQFVKDKKFEITAVREVTTVALTNATKVEFILTIDGATKNQLVSPAFIDAIDLVKPVMAIEKVTYKETATIVNVNGTDDKGKVAAYYILPSKVIDEDRNEKIEFAVNNIPLDKLALEVKNRGNKYNNGIIKLERNIVEIIAIAVDTAGNLSTPIIAPIQAVQLSKDMRPIKWQQQEDGSLLEVTTDITDPEWFDYPDGKWANAKAADGSYFVWIPRFEYKIIYVDPANKTAGAKILVNLIPVNQVKPTEGYKIHPAFRDGRDNNFANGEWDKEISGFWVAKYEMSEAGGGSAKSIPGVVPYLNTSIGNFYNAAYNYDRDKESHLMKNSEWGAVAYLTHSKYGRNGVEVTINGTEYTGGYKPYENTIQSSTGNITGVYDLSGLSWEYTAGYLNNGNINLSYGDAFTKQGVSTKYATLYPKGTTDTAANNFAALSKLFEENKRYGDAIVETSQRGDSANTGMFKDNSYLMYISSPYIYRGGFKGSGTKAGIFAYAAVSGQPYTTASFRVVLCGI